MPPPFGFTFDASVASFHTSRRAHLCSHPGFDSIAVGAIVFSTHGDGRRVLLVQRASHDSWPLRWEIPGGACDRDDATLLHGLARELWEETGLVMRHVVQCIAQEGEVFVSSRGLRVVRYSFVVEVEQPAEVKLNPEEHERFLWATEDECRVRRVGDLDVQFTSEPQAATIMQAFRAVGESASHKEVT